jgi:alanyl-tRNA synthetase
MTPLEIKNRFISFFEKKGYLPHKESPLIPQSSDNTLLFTNAGMNQFKDYFTSKETPPQQKITTAQPCLRVGGKHNDLQEVGFTSRHLTLFTMLGTFGFNSKLSKKEAIRDAWTFLTEKLKLDTSLLHITTYKEDKESYDIWKNDIGIVESHLSTCGEKDNFWSMGEEGLCGPSTDIYFDQGINNASDAISFPSDEKSDRFLEIWGLVFMEYNRLSDKTLDPLTKKGVDTGMGFERLMMVLENKKSVFESSVFKPLITSLEKITDVTYTKENASSFHVIVDHIRSIVALISEGICPSNEGRGYVLRKIVRRAALFVKKITAKKSTLLDLAHFLVTSPELDFTSYKGDIKEIEKIIDKEMTAFWHVLEAGKNRFIDLLKKQKNSLTFHGKDAFLLYDTYGFPLEITQLLAHEHKKTVETKSYEAAMEEQKNRSKKHSEFQNRHAIMSDKTTTFSYEKLIIESNITELWKEGISVKEAEKDEEVTIIFDTAVLYPTGGGQIHDKGILMFSHTQSPVLNVKKYGKAIGVTVTLLQDISVGEKCRQEIDKQAREESEKHHSATHLLYKAISEAFPHEKIRQGGSYVCDTYLSLDIIFKDNQDINEDIKQQIQNNVNTAINKGKPIEASYTTLEKAESEGVTADFTEKYDKEKVRVITIEGITKDLCGGCHAKNTKDLGLFILKSVESTGNQTKCFVGFTGKAAYRALQEQQRIITNVKRLSSCKEEEIICEIEKKNLQNKEKNNELKSVKEHYIALLAKYATSSDQATPVIFEELPPQFKGLERNFLETITKKNLSFIAISTKTKENTAIYLAEENDSLTNEKKDTIKKILEEHGFIGNKKKNRYYGIIPYNKRALIEEAIKNKLLREK